MIRTRRFVADGADPQCQSSCNGCGACRSRRAAIVLVVQNCPLHPHGIEARCGYGNEEDLLMSQVERTPDTARARADEWKQTALAKGFQELL